MRISSRRVSLVVPGLMLACSINSSSSSNEGSSNSSASNSSVSTSGGGCGGGGAFADFGGDSDVQGAPASNGGVGRPSEPAPTGQKWKPIESDEGCGRMGITWVLVDEVCGDGEGNDDPGSLRAPMFRDGAIVDGHLFAVDATHLWTFDLAKPSESSRSSLLTGLGTPLAVDKRDRELVLASGAAGLVMVDTTDAAAPKRSRSLELAGKAFDVQVGGDKAFVALGAAGIAEVDLARTSPSVNHTWPVGGFSAGIAARGSYAFVAACSTFKVVDLTNGQVVSEAWVPNAMVKNRLVAPAKKVTLVGDVAYVAAGRFGAVAIDIADPKKPSVLGNCTVPDDPAFYASGVRASGSSLYVAAGEWGIYPIDVSDSKAACSKLMQQSVPAEEPATNCSAKPPWDVVPWEKVWSAPPPGKDPVQTLPVGDRVYAFGDARRVGVRAVDVRDALDPKLPIVRRFDEPRALLGIAAKSGRVVAVGPRGGVFDIGEAGSLSRTLTTADATLRAASAVTLLADGRWVSLGAGGLAVEGKPNAIALAVSDGSSIAAAADAKVVVASRELEVIDVDSGQHAQPPLVDVAHLPLSVAADATGIYYAAPEWMNAGRLVAGSSSKISAHTLFDADDIMDPASWRVRLPRHLLLTTPHGLVEIAGVGSTAGLEVHVGSNIANVTLPAMTYAAAATDGDHVYLAGIDRSLYRSYVVSVDISGPQPKVLGVESFTGAASGIAVAAGRVFVADADGAIRSYGVTSAGIAAFVSSTEVSP